MAKAESIPADRRLGRDGHISWLPAGSWILYDLANTIYAGAVTYLLVPFFKETYENYTAIGITQTVTMVASGLIVPLMATICDRTGQTRLYLSVFTLLCIGSMFGWAAWTSSFMLIAFLTLGNFSYQNALVFYNAFLPSVAPPHRTGLISGIGVGIGYLGTIVTILVALLLNKLGFGFRATCAICGTLFLVTALPCLLFVSDKRVIDRQKFSVHMIRDRFGALLHSVGLIRRNRTVLLFFLGNFFLVDVLNTAIFFFAGFTEDIFEPLAESNRLVFLGTTMQAQTYTRITGLALCSSALVLGIGSGYLSDKLHPIRVLRASGWCLFAGLLGAIVVGGRSPMLYLLTMGIAGAGGMAGIWTSGRKVLLLIAPPSDITQYFGLYGITLKLSVIGSTTFAIAADVAFWWLTDRMTTDVALVTSRKIAIAVQLIPLLLGLWLLHKLRVDELGRTDGGTTAE